MSNHVLRRPKFDSPFDAREHLLAAMYFPNDRGKQAGFIKSCLGHDLGFLIRDGAIKTEAAPEVLDFIRAGHEFETLHEKALVPFSRSRSGFASLHGGVIAANLFGKALMIMKETGGRLGIGAARVECADFWGKPPFCYVNADERRLRLAWRAYRGVAHLWLTLELFGRYLPRTFEQHAFFLSHAEALRTAGETAIQLHSSFPLLLPGETWRPAPEWPLKPANLVIDSQQIAVELLNLDY